MLVGLKTELTAGLAPSRALKSLGDGGTAPSTRARFSAAVAPVPMGKPSAARAVVWIKGPARSEDAPALRVAEIVPGAPYRRSPRVETLAATVPAGAWPKAVAEPIPGRTSSVGDEKP